ncbi:hypothetical protein Btru_065097 [Bulinus truncatus]|nr:hypothetical protein Btru_065097 [Bulinus truncatus]
MKEQLFLISLLSAIVPGLRSHQLIAVSSINGLTEESDSGAKIVFADFHRGTFVAQFYGAFDATILPAFLQVGKKSRRW